VSLCFVLFLIFLVLKLAGVVAWSWLVVCIPLIAEVGFDLLALLIVIVVSVWMSR
jgi:hypothetical protein